ESSPAFRLLAVIAGFAPAIAAIVVRKWVERSGFGDAGLGLAPEQWRYYLAAILIPLAIVAFIVIAAPMLGLATPNFASADGKAIPAPLLLIFALFAAVILWGEEFGWRSYLQIRIFPERPLIAAIVTGLIWGVWHYPLLIANPELPRH